MTTATLNEVKDNLLAFVKKAEVEEVVLIHDGKPVGILEGFSSDDDLEEHHLLGNKRFQNMIAKSRQEFRDGKVTRLDDLD